MRLWNLFYALASAGARPQGWPGLGSQVIRTADRLGYTEAWIGEHFTAPWEPNPAPDLLIAQALMQTKRIKLAPGAHLLPYHHPLNWRAAWPLWIIWPRAVRRPASARAAPPATSTLTLSSALVPEYRLPTETSRSCATTPSCSSGSPFVHCARH